MVGAVTLSFVLRSMCCLAFLGPACQAIAEVVTDGTVGRPVQLEGPDYQVGAELGRRAGGNLFHSFEQFNIRKLPDGTIESATFSGPDDIRNVISRVTGGSRSDIDGTIASTLPGADFYFLNPAGVLFGPNARLDVQGSFHVSTADELRFADGAVFSATNTAASSFTVAGPEAFGFLRPNPASIVVDRSTLDVPAGETFSIVGGDITIDGGNNGVASGGEAGATRAKAGRIMLAAVGGPGEVRLESGDVIADSAADIRLIDQALVDTSGDGGGTILIRGGRLIVEGESFVSADNTGLSDATAGMDVQAEHVRIVEGSALTANVTSGTGTGGTVQLSAVSLEISGNSFLGANTLAEGNAGRVIAEADQLSIDGAGTDFAGIISNAEEGSTGDAGLVRVRAGRLDIVNGGEIDSSTSAEGNAGSVTVEADQLNIDGAGAGGFTGIQSEAREGSAGNAGEVRVTASELSIFQGGEIATSTFAEGDAGGVVVEADRLTIDGAGAEFAGIFSDAKPASTGDAGRVTVRAGRLDIVNDGEIASNTFAEGNAGTVIVEADQLSIAGDSDDAFTGITSATLAEGDAGRVIVEADQLSIAGDADAPIGITSAAVDGSSGDAGIVTVTSRRLELDGGNIATISESAGGGAIELRVDDFIDLRNSAVTTSVAGGTDPTAGNITVDSKILVIDNSQIQANAPAGFGGNLTIATDNILVDGGNLDALLARKDISATGADPARAGTVVVSAPDVNLAGDLVVLDVPLLDAASLLRERCAARRDVGASSFTGVGRGGLPPGPDQPLMSDYRISAAPRGETLGPEASEREVALRGASPLLLQPCAGAP
jgi:filamentous hemagglutinin family protein